MEQNTNIQTPITFTNEELAAQGYTNPGAHPALANAQTPITFTGEELEAQGYTNPDQHPALDTRHETRQIEVSDTSTGRKEITVKHSDIAEGALRMAVAERKLYKPSIDEDVPSVVVNKSHTVMTPQEIADARNSSNR